MFGRAIALALYLSPIYIHLSGKHINKTKTLMYRALHSKLIDSSLIYFTFNTKKSESTFALSHIFMAQSLSSNLT